MDLQLSAVSLNVSGSAVVNQISDGEPKADR
jgi:hypothetical protein